MIRNSRPVLPPLARKHSLRSSASRSSINSSTRQRLPFLKTPSEAGYAPALQTLLSLLDTALPVALPSETQAPGRPFEDSSLLNKSLRDASLAAPSYPPRLTTSSRRTQANVDVLQTPHTVSESQNLTFLKTILSHGVHPELALRLGAPAASDRRSPWQQTAEAQALNRLVATLGIAPFLDKPHVTESHDAANAPAGNTDTTTAVDNLDAGANTDEAAEPHNSAAAADPNPDPAPANTNDNATQTEPAREDESDTLFRATLFSCARDPTSELAYSFKAIRFAAQKKVYHMRYLSRKRAWGPFLRVHTEGEEDSSDEDDEYSPPSDSESDWSTAEAVGNSEDEDELLGGNDGDWMPRRNRLRKPLPTAPDLRADWEHLAAIRVVVQARLEEKMRTLHTNFGQWFEPGQLEEFHGTLLGWQNIRAGVWSTGPTNGENQIGEQKGAGSSSGAAEAGPSALPKTPSEPLVEWDWAGVEGIWR